MLSIFILLEVLLSKDLSYKGAILRNALPEELKHIVSATKFSGKLTESYIND